MPPDFRALPAPLARGWTVALAMRAVNASLDTCAKLCGMLYERSTYTLRRFEVIAPHVRNDGTPSGYPAAFAAGLRRAGFTGWTEHAPHVGYWQGKRETGTRFEVFAPDERLDEREPMHVRPFPTPTRPTADVLAEVARAAMPDQDAVQLVVGEVVELREA